MNDSLKLTDFLKRNYKLLIVVLFAAAFFFSPLREKVTVSQFTMIIKSAKDMPFSSLVFVLVYILAVVLCFPGIAFMFLAGSIFGFWKGFLLASIASNIGCQLTFFISRYIGKEFLERILKIDRLLSKVSGKIDKNGFMIMLYIRLIPLFPFNVVNYALGLTDISHRDYTLGTLVGKVPAMTLYILLASKFSNIENSKHMLPVYVLALISFTSFTIFLEKKQKVFK